VANDLRCTITRREFGALGFGLIATVTRASDDVAARLHIAADGTVTVVTGKVEIGQGSRTVLTKVVAEELGVPASRVRVVMGDTALVPDDGGTYASLTAPQTVPVVRKAAVETRRMLDRLEGAVAESTRWASLAPINSRAIVTGAQKYPTDFSVAGMRHGKVLRAPGLRAKLESVEGAIRDGDFAGVVADTPDAAAKLARAAKAAWSVEPLPEGRYKEKSIPPKPGEGGRYPALITNGDVDAGLKESARRHEGHYTIPAIAHVPLEPRAAIAQWEGERLTVWTGAQVPFGVRKELATAFKIPDASVRVICLDAGGGFGGKHRGECELEAARLAKAAGAPVKVAWTREEEFTCSYCRPAGIVDLESGLDASGRIYAWRHRNYNSGAASLRPPYAIPHLSSEFHRAESPVRVGPYRSLAAVLNTFARESHVNELAALVKADPLEFRLRNIDDERLRVALQRAAEKFGWGKRKGGLACNIEKDSRLALFVEMDGVKVSRMVAAYDVGAIINADGLENQVQGALVQGIGGALFEKLEFDARTCINPRLSQYRVPRFSDLPEIEVILIDNPAIPSAGAGEAPITVVAPAIAAALGGVKRSLPLLG
jgi:isoquinoline 1-oxidoreductase